MFWFNQNPANCWKTKCECSTEKCIWKGLVLVQILYFCTTPAQHRHFWCSLHRYTVVGTNLVIHHTGWISILDKFIGFIIFLDIIMDKVFPAIIINIKSVCHFRSRWASHSIWILKFEKLLEIQNITWLVFLISFNSPGTISLQGTFGVWRDVKVLWTQADEGEAEI